MFLAALCAYCWAEQYVDGAASLLRPSVSQLDASTISLDSTLCCTWQSPQSHVWAFWPLCRRERDISSLQGRSGCAQVVKDLQKTLAPYSITNHHMSHYKAIFTARLYKTESQATATLLRCAHWLLRSLSGPDLPLLGFYSAFFY